MVISASTGKIRFILSKIFKVSHLFTAGREYINSINDHLFGEFALDLFRYQYEGNTLYRSYCDALHVDPARVTGLTSIPFLPISFFKTHAVKTGDWIQPQLVFESSGTTAETPARHYVKDTTLYEASLLTGFSDIMGPPADYAILALLPSYLERKNASLVHMASVLMANSRHPDNGFYLDEWEALAGKLKHLNAAGQKTLLLGVTFALIDFATANPMDISKIIVMETGGMKGRREEWTRLQVHEFLQQQWQLPEVASEYGMTELLSQAYALREGLLTPSRTMRVMIREISDPLSVHETGNGVLNIIDLANVHSCAFIATEDIGNVYDAGTFEVLGRLDNAALRGCSLMTA
jgi:hypothetical protein